MNNLQESTIVATVPVFVPGTTFAVTMQPKAFAVQAQMRKDVSTELSSLSLTVAHRETIVLLQSLRPSGENMNFTGLVANGNRLDAVKGSLGAQGTFCLDDTVTQAPETSVDILRSGIEYHLARRPAILNLEKRLREGMGRMHFSTTVSLQLNNVEYDVAVANLVHHTHGIGFAGMVACGSKLQAVRGVFGNLGQVSTLRLAPEVRI